MYRRVHRIRDGMWPERSSWPSASVMADYVRRMAAERDRHSGGQETKITVGNRALAQICNESYPARTFRAFLGERELAKVK